MRQDQIDNYILFAISYNFSLIHSFKKEARLGNYLYNGISILCNLLTLILPLDLIFLHAFDVKEIQSK